MYKRISTLIALISFFPLMTFLERSLLSHLLVQFPLLIMLGVVLSQRLSWPQQLSWPQRVATQPRRWCPINPWGIAGMLLSTAVLLAWMLPRWLDWSLEAPHHALIKYVSLVFLIGFPLGASWSKLHAVARAVVKVEFLTMLLRLAWLYLISPSRLCNNYPLDEQRMLGWSVLLIAACLIAFWSAGPLFGLNSNENKG